jgi:hypothetical protein
MENTKLGKNIEQYIHLVYSDKSELNRIQDLEERKKVACEKAKLKYDDNLDMIHMKDDKVNEAIFDFLRKQTPNKFILLISNQHLFWEMQQKLMKPLKADDDDEESCLKEVNLKNTISEKSDSLLERIEKLYKDVFRDTESVSMAVTKVRALTPEAVLKKQKTA